MKDRLTQEDLQKLKHWVEKRTLCKSPHCGEKCIITERKEKENATGNNDNPRHT